MTLTTLLTQLEQGKISAEVAEKHVRARINKAYWLGLIRGLKMLRVLNK
jgi:hypothetical protein